MDTFSCGLLHILCGSDCDRRLCTLSFVHHLFFFKHLPGKKKQQLRSIVSQPQTSQQDVNYLSSQFLRLRHSQQEAADKNADVVQ